LEPGEDDLPADSKASDLFSAPTQQLTRPVAAPPPHPSSTSSLPATLQKLWASPVAFGAIFVVGFFIAFVIGAVALWGGADVESLLASGQADAALAALEAKGRLTPEEMLLQGHAFHQKGNRDAMLRAYQGAVAGKAVDARALENTFDALGNDKVASLAVKTLEDWPGDDVNDRLVALAADGTAHRRHAAFESLRTRPSSTPNQRLLAAIKVAVTDVNSEVCEDKAAGIAAIAELVERPEAAPMLKAANAWKAVYEQSSDVVFANHRCLDAPFVKRTLTSLSAIVR